MAVKTRPVSSGSASDDDNVRYFRPSTESEPPFKPTALVFIIAIVVLAVVAGYLFA